MIPVASNLPDGLICPDFRSRDWPRAILPAITAATALDARTTAESSKPPSVVADPSEPQAMPELELANGGPFPSPDLSPLQVVGIQLDALRRNDQLGHDAGIAITFRFASAANRAVTGPLERFAGMLKDPLYRPMIDHDSARFGPAQVEGDVARVQVVLFGRGGEVAAYDFTLSKDEDTGCWLTDGVMLAPVERT